MPDLFTLIAHLLVTVAKLARPGGLGAVAAESLAVKNQLLIMKRARRSPNLTSWDRLVLGICALFVSPKRLSKMAVILKPSTLLSFHRALVKRKYSLLYRPKERRRPGPKGPSRELIGAVMEMKRRNPLFGCRKIAEQISIAFAVEINKDVVRRILIRHYRPGPAICRMFNRAIAKQTPSRYLSSDRDPLFRFHRWLANFRVLEVDEIKAIPCTPRSQPFVERLIGTVRREYLDRTLFWNQSDLERKLETYKAYYNQHRCHSGLAGATPAERSGAPPPPIAKLESYSWRQHCNGLFQTPVAA